ncbi:MAG: transposase family protein [Nostoc sp.]
MEDQLLMTLEYWREYRTYFHIGQSWGVSCCAFNLHKQHFPCFLFFFPI